MSKNMYPKKIVFFSEYRKYGVPVWQCPEFVFAIMGVIIMAALIISYAVGSQYVDDPYIIAISVLILATVLFIVTFVVVQGVRNLVEANIMKSEFIKIVSHQLRSPLTNISWTVGLLMSEGIKDKENHLETLKENSARMKELINDLLFVSHLEQKSIPFQKQEVVLNDTISSLISNFDALIQKQRVKVKLNLPENSPVALIDQSHIRMVLENLIENAIKYSKEGGLVEINLSIKGNKCYFQIKDQGIGISKMEQRYIFQKFFRTKGATDHQSQGTGLGLYMSKKVINNWGGDMGFDSGEGVGSSFWFTLPLIFKK